MYPINQFKVTIQCPLTHKEEEVFFHQVGECHVAFDGCDHEYHACKECEDCRKKAYQKLINQD